MSLWMPFSPKDLILMLNDPQLKGRQLKWIYPFYFENEFRKYHTI